MQDAQSLEHDGPLSCGSYYQIIREQVHHEDELINDRLSWLIQSQSIFLAAYALVLTSKPDFMIVRFVLIAMALSITILIWRGVSAAVKVMRSCVQMFLENCPAKGHAVGALPTLLMSDRIHEDGLAPAIRLPLTFTIAWLAIAVLYGLDVGHWMMSNCVLTAK